MLNFITWNVKPQIIQFENFEIRWYSLLFGLGFIIGYYIMQKMFKREGIKLELLDKLTFYIIIATILGARFGHCIFYEPETYLKAPWKIILPFTGTPGIDFKFTGFQGLASHGGAIGILIGLALYARKFKVNYLWILDRIAIVTALAGAFIRLGNLFNSEIYGVETSLPWGFKFMREILYPPFPTAEEIVPKHPTQLYEALAYLIIFGLLMYFYKAYQKYKHGFFIGWFMILVFTARFFIEFVKEDQVGFEAGMSFNMGQWLSIPFIIAGIFLVARKTPPQGELKKA
jgi:prolipoprotein diacylglyceryl transferase